MDPSDYLEQKALDRLASDSPTNKDIADGVKVIINRLWSKDELTALIVQTHHQLCAECTRLAARPASHEAASDKAWYQKVIWALITAACAALAYFCKT